MAEVKGVLLHGWMAYLNEHHGAQGVKQAIARLEPRERALMGTGVFLAASWYPYETLHAFRTLTRQLTPNADRNTAIDIGRSMAWHAFSSLAESAGNPIDRVASFARISEGHFRETRSLESQVTGPASCLVRYRYVPGVTPTRAICSSLTGFWTCVLEMMGATRVTGAHTRCVLDGAPLCEFTFAWAPESRSTGLGATGDTGRRALGWERSGRAGPVG